MKHDAKQLGGLFTSDWLIQFALYDRVYWIPSKKPVLREKAFSIYMVICCSEGSCPDLAFFPLQKPIQGTKPNPQQGGEGTGAQRQFPAVWYHFLPLTWASSGTGVSKLGSHHPLYVAGTTFGLGDEQSEISLQLSQCCDEMTESSIFQLLIFLAFQWKAENLFSICCTFTGDYNCSLNLQEQETH